jgi:integrase
MFKWAVAEELLSVETYQRLCAVTGLQRGRTEAREADPIGPVSDAQVEAVLPHLTATVADMVRFQRLTGCRPNEVCHLRPMDVDRSGDVWRYVPQSHKTEHHGRQRIIFIGPKAQAILLRYLARDAAMYCFRPIDSEAKRRAEQRASRKTPESCGNKPGSNRKRKPKRTPSEVCEDGCGILVADVAARHVAVRLYLNHDWPTDVLSFEPRLKILPSMCWRARQRWKWASTWVDWMPS